MRGRKQGKPAVYPFCAGCKAPVPDGFWAHGWISTGHIRVVGSTKTHMALWCPDCDRSGVYATQQVEGERKGCVLVIQEPVSTRLGGQM